MIPSLAALALSAAVAPTGVAVATMETGAIAGAVLTANGAAVANARVRAASASFGTFVGSVDDHGRFLLARLRPDTYTLNVTAPGFVSASLKSITVLPSVTVTRVIYLKPLPQIGAVTARVNGGVPFGRAADSYEVRGEAASGLLTATSSGLGQYSAGTALGAVSNLPGIAQDQFSDVIARGSKVYDSAFQYDGVPLPQELISSPGGTTFGSPLTTAGVAYVTVAQAGFTSGGDNAFGAIVDEIPISGSYPGQTTLSLGTNLSATNSKFVELEQTDATPDQRIRWAFALTSKDEQLPIGDGTQFYTGVAGGMGLDYSTQATSAGMANVHVALGSNEDLELLGMAGSAHFDQYGQPYEGLIYANANGLKTTFPGVNPYAPVNQPGFDTGNYSLQKLQYTKGRKRSTTIVRVSRGQNYGSSDIVVGSDLTFPLGFNSYDGHLYYNSYAAALDVRNQAGENEEDGYGIELRQTYNELYQIIPIIDDTTTSNVRTNSLAAWLYDRRQLSEHFSTLASLRLIGAHEMRTDGNDYDISQLDPHLGIAYQNGRYALTANYDHISQLPLPNAVQRIDSGAAVPFVPLGVERGNHFTFAFERNGPTSFRLVYWLKLENNRIDILPAGFAVQGSSTSVGASPSAIGLPENLSRYRARGVDLEFQHGPFSLVASYAQTWTVDPSQYNLNQVNPALLASGQLIPQGFFPALTSSLQYVWRRRKTTIVPSLSYESGYPYGNGTKVWVLDKSGTAVQVDNDNHVDPGYAYYFLRNPAFPFNPVTNPYVADLDTGEGPTPYTLHAPPRTFITLRGEQQLTRRLKLTLVANNLLNFVKPTQYISNPYMPGPPGYTGGNPYIAAWMSKQWGTGLGLYRNLPYLLGNGIPTLDGYHPEFGPQFNYGTEPYVAGALPYGRMTMITMTYSL